MKKLLEEFKTFALKGNVIDMAVGVIIGGAFGKIVTSVVNDIFMPLVGVLIGGMDFKNLSFTIGSAAVMYGNFIQNVVDFLIIAVIIFAFVKGMTMVRRTKEEPAPQPGPARTEEAVLLEQILEQLRKDTPVQASGDGEKVQEHDGSIE